MIKRSQRGVVLLLVLGAVAVLTILAIELSHRASLDAIRSARTGKDAEFRRCFDSGIELAKGLIIEQSKSQGYVYWGDGWGREVATDLGPGERITVRVCDENSKFNLAQIGSNGATAGAAKKSLARVFEWLRTNDPEREKQWVDAEAAVRQRMGIDITKATVSAILTLDGLREAGIPCELVFGKLDATQRNGKPALCDVFTVFGNGQVNLNTAHPAVLFSLDPQYDAGLVERICAYRGGVDFNDSKKFVPFRSVAELGNVDGVIKRATIDGRVVVVQDLLSIVQDRLTVSNNCFSARVRADVDGKVREAWAFFEAKAVSANVSTLNIRLLSYEEIEP